MDVVLGLPTSANLREAPAGASTKHVSMRKAKAASPPITNFSASACRLTPVFSVPVIILPIDAQSLDINNILIILIIFIMLLNFNGLCWRQPPPPLPLYLTPGLWHLFFRNLILFFLSLRVVAPHLRRCRFS